MQDVADSLDLALFVDGMCVVVTYVTMSVWYTHLLPGEARCE